MKKGTQIILCISLCFVFLMTGVFVGRNTISGNLTIESSGQKPNTPEDPSITNSFSERKININTAGVDELTLLPNIGETLAKRIIAYRTANGSFKKIEDITKVEGIGDVRFTQISKYITVGD